MKIKELFTKGNGIFTKYFKPNYPTPYTAIFGDVDPTNLDNYVWLKYGNQEVFPAIDNNNVGEYIDCIIEIDKDNWINASNIYNTQYDPLNHINNEITTSSTTESSTTDAKTNVTSSATFNDVSLTDKGKDVTDINQSSNVVVTSTNVSKGIGNKSISAELRKEIDFKLTNFRKSVIFAIVNELTLQIYD